MTYDLTMRLWRGDANGGAIRDYTVSVEEGEVVLESGTHATEARKARHLDICLDDDVASSLDAGWSSVRLRHEALPEIALAEVDASARFLGFRLRAPILISRPGSKAFVNLRPTCPAATARIAERYVIGSLTVISRRSSAKNSRVGRTPPMHGSKSRKVAFSTAWTTPPAKGSLAGPAPRSPSHTEAIAGR